MMRHHHVTADTIVLIGILSLPKIFYYSLYEMPPPPRHITAATIITTRRSIEIRIEGLAMLRQNALMACAYKSRLFSGAATSRRGLPYIYGIAESKDAERATINDHCSLRHVPSSFQVFYARFYIFLFIAPHVAHFSR